MTEEEKSQGIFLTQENLFLWKRPPKPGYIKTSMGLKYNAQTELVESLGMEIFNQDVGRYSVQATAAKYLARVIFLDESEKVLWHRDKITGTPRRRIIFRGTISIYNRGQIPGTELEGFDLESTGRIWLARPPNPRYRGRFGLYNIILGKAEIEEGKEKRIKAIIRGYEEIEEKRERISREREHTFFQSGRSQAEEKAFGTFGRRF